MESSPNRIHLAESAKGTGSLKNLINLAHSSGSIVYTVGALSEMADRLHRDIGVQKWRRPPPNRLRSPRIPSRRSAPTSLPTAIAN
jgi:hypothetical protein